MKTKIRMSLPVVIGLQGLLAGLAIALAFWTAMPWFSIVAIVLLLAGMVAARLAPISRRKKIQRWTLALGWAWSVYIAIGFGSLDLYCAIVCWLIAGALLAAGLGADDAAALRWCKLFGFLWAFGGGFVWLAAAYVGNEPGGFYLALLLNVGVLVLFRCLFRGPGWLIQVVNSLLLLLIGLPLFDVLTHRHFLAAEPMDPARKYYSYEVARKDPADFERWTVYFEHQVWKMGTQVYIADPSRRLPWKLKPGSRGWLGQSRIRINRLGFRGKEIAKDKGRAYRIVALGESTTFGFTFTADHRPWPELLEQMITTQLTPGRPVEVINAGVAAYDLEQNLSRLRGEILPLKPDMIISYHGCFNGFHLLWQGESFEYIVPPRYQARPLSVLADVEYRLKALLYKRRLLASLARHPPVFLDPIKTRYARAYERLIEFARTNHIRLVLGNYSMAVNARSDPAVVAFYRMQDPRVDWLIQANAAHSDLVKELARRRPEVGWVDTHPGLDGEYEKFIDLMHFDRQGDQQLAKVFFDAIRPTLEEEFASSTPLR